MAVQTAITPYRKTLVTWDLSEPTVSEQPFAIQRSGQEIARAVTDAAGASSKVHLLGSGAWTLEPFQERPNTIQERTDHQSAALRLPDFTTIPAYVEAPRWRSPADLTGATAGADPSLAASGDYFLHKTVPAGGSWAQSLTADETAYGRPPVRTQNIKMDRHAVTNTPLPADTPVFLRIHVPGTKQHSPDVIYIYYLGGMAQPDGSGQFGLAFLGDGTCEIYEKIGIAWQFRDQFKYTTGNRVADADHYIRIWPHRAWNLRGGYIEFTFFTIEQAAPRGGNLTTFGRKHASVDKYIYPLPFRPTAGGGAPRTNVTGMGPARIDIRRDHRIRWQMSRLRFPATGNLVDQAFAVPLNMSTRSNLVLSWYGDVPTGASLVGKLYDAATNAELTLVSSGSDYREYQPTYQKSAYYAKFTMTSDAGGTVTPLLWGYKVQRDGYIITPSGITPLNGGILRSVSVSGPESDPSHETSSYAVDDMTASLTTLRTRSSIRTRITSQYDSLLSGPKTVLFDGYTQRVTATRRSGSRHKQGIGNAGATRLYPSANWNHLDATAMGMWTRLHEAVVPVYLPVGVDRLAPADPQSGGKPPWKVTDLVRTMLSWAGFTSSQIDVPDHPARFWPTVAIDAGELVLTPLQNIAELIVKFLRDYMGYFLIWDGNAGVGGTPNSSGMWRVRGPSVSPYANLWNFLTTPPAGKVTTRPESYANTGASDSGFKKNWTGTAAAIGQAFIAKDTFQTYVKPPEANMVVVSSSGELLPNKDGSKLHCLWAVNPKSFDFYADAGGAVIHSADPAHPDYLGRCVPLYFVDNSLTTDQAIRFAVRRLYDVTCHAIKMATFEAPLVLVTDGTDTKQINPRPLRYYDPVQITDDDGSVSQWLVRNVNPTYHKDGYQMARYELEAPRI